MNATDQINRSNHLFSTLWKQPQRLTDIENWQYVSLEPYWKLLTDGVDEKYIYDKLEHKYGVWWPAVTPDKTSAVTELPVQKFELRADWNQTTTVKLEQYVKYTQSHTLL